MLFRLPFPPFAFFLSRLWAVSPLLSSAHPPCARLCMGLFLPFPFLLTADSLACSFPYRLYAYRERSSRLVVGMGCFCLQQFQEWKSKWIITVVACGQILFPMNQVSSWRMQFQFPFAVRIRLLPHYIVNPGS